MKTELSLVDGHGSPYLAKLAQRDADQIKYNAAIAERDAYWKLYEERSLDLSLLRAERNALKAQLTNMPTKEEAKLWMSLIEQLYFFMSDENRVKFGTVVAKLKSIAEASEPEETK